MNFDEENLKVLSRSAGDDRAMLADDVLEARAKVRRLETKNKLMTIRLKAIIETLETSSSSNDIWVKTLAKEALEDA